MYVYERESAEQSNMRAAEKRVQVMSGNGGAEEDKGRGEEGCGS